MDWLHLNCRIGKILTMDEEGQPSDSVCSSPYRKRMRAWNASERFQSQMRGKSWQILRPSATSDQDSSPFWVVARARASMAREPSGAARA